jgi:hypothetical protein
MESPMFQSKMARILFIVNEHPTEAFEIAVARETKKLLKREGHQVVLSPLRLKETSLGAIFEHGPQRSYGETLAKAIDSTNPKKVMKKAINSSKPDITYRFHCTHHKCEFWKETKKHEAADFDICRDWPFDTFVETVEIKAHFKSMPRRVLDRIDPNGEMPVDYHYTQTTSHQLTTKAGLTPEEFARSIAAGIKNQIREVEAGKPPSNVRDLIKRKYNERSGRPQRPRVKAGKPPSNVSDVRDLIKRKYNERSGRAQRPRVKAGKPPSNVSDVRDLIKRKYKERSGRPQRPRRQVPRKRQRPHRLRV